MAPAGMSALLDADGVAEYLQRRGVIPTAADATAVELGGGISNIVLAVEARGRHFVVKQSLPRLRVHDEWLAKRERILTEAAALRVARRLTPENVPVVIDADDDAFALTISSAPPTWRNWKRVLLDDRADPAVGADLGRVLARWHDATWADGAIAERFADYEAFEQLRLDPFHLTVAQRLPAAAPALEQAVEDLRTTRLCLVHGDYSPKNVLIGADGLWVLDFEVAHFGNPVFDVAFMLTHLVLTALHVGARANELCDTGTAFWDAYNNALADRAPAEDALVRHVACLCLARTDGKSREDYLTVDECERARPHALALLDSGSSFDDLWRLPT
jgi:5-methylthioribose kinase